MADPISFSAPPSIMLLTGVPGVGKTTAIRRVAENLKKVKRGGFYTEEIRVNRRRQGFRLVSFTGQERIIAHVDWDKHFRVGQYGVDVQAIDEMASRLLMPDPSIRLYLIDEIGKMECLSQRFVCTVRALLNSDHRVIATVARRGGGFIAEVKQREDSLLWEVTRENRDELPERIVDWFNQLQKASPS